MYIMAEDWKSKGYDSFMNREPNLSGMQDQRSGALGADLTKTPYPDGTIPPSALQAGQMIGDFRITDGSIQSRDYKRAGTGWRLNSDGTTDGIGADPAGNNTNIQFNNNGSFGGSDSLIWEGWESGLKILNNAGEGGINLKGESGGVNAYITASPNTRLVITGGVGITNGPGRDVQIDGGEGDTDETGGSVAINGAIGSGSGNGGNVDLSGGNANLTGIPGDITLTPGKNIDSGESRNVVINLENGDTTQGASFILSNAGVGGLESKRKCLDDTTNGLIPGSMFVTDIPDDTTLFVEARVIARRTGGSAGSDGDSAMYVRRALFKRIGSSAAVLVGSVQDVFTVEDQSSWGCSIIANVSEIHILFNGATNNEVFWSAEVLFFFAATG